MTTTVAKERPILFSGPMVRAILAGKKTQTRRVVMSGARNMQESGQVCVKRNPDNDPWYKEHVWSVRQRGGVWGDFTHEQMLARCPYGLAGDRLWVRETWHHEDTSCNDHKCGQPTHIYHKATETFPESIRWRPSIYMQRWASRITLEIEEVRVEQLHQITEEDAQAEGLEQEFIAGYTTSGRAAWPRFVELWDSINKERGFGWKSNPWVWVIEFRRIHES